MPLAVDLMAIGLPAEQANRLGGIVVDRAGTGTTQAGATTISMLYERITATVDDYAFVLPPNAELLSVYIISNESEFPAMVYPNPGSFINDGAVDEPVGLAPREAYIFIFNGASWTAMGTDGNLFGYVIYEGIFVTYNGDYVIYNG